MPFFTQLRYFVKDIQRISPPISERLANDVNGGGGTATSPVTRSTDCSLSKGVYYLKVNPAWNRTGKYKLNASFTSYNTNDAFAISYDSPQELSLNSSVTGAITETDKEDWYCIHIHTSKNYLYRLTTYCRMYFKLYNEDLSKEIASMGWDLYRRK